MSLKKKLGLGIASAALGISLVGGGTFAYFTDTETVNNTMVAGTLDLVPELESYTQFNVTAMAPGDWVEKQIDFKNTGNVDIKEILFGLVATNNDVPTPNGVTPPTGTLSNLKETLKVTVFDRDNNPITALSNKTLAEIEALGKVEISGNGLAANNADTDRIKIRIDFDDNEQNQNHLQGDSVNIQLIFEAKQRDGIQRNN